jgi:hypothetical protein
MAVAKIIKIPILWVFLLCFLPNTGTVKGQAPNIERQFGESLDCNENIIKFHHEPNRPILTIRNSSVQLVYRFMIGSRTRFKYLTGTLIAVANPAFRFPNSSAPEYRFYIATAAHGLYTGTTSDDVINSLEDPIRINPGTDLFIYFNNHLSYTSAKERHPTDPYFGSGQYHFCFSPAQNDCSIRIVLDGWEKEEDMYIDPQDRTKGKRSDRDYALLEVTLTTLEDRDRFMSFNPCFAGWELYQYDLDELPVNMSIEEKKKRISSVLNETNRELKVPVHLASHPQGDVKKYVNSLTDDNRMLRVRPEPLFYFKYDGGTTGLPQQGSSGAGHINYQGRLFSIFLGPNGADAPDPRCFDISSFRSRAVYLSNLLKSVNSSTAPDDYIKQNNLFPIYPPGLGTSISSYCASEVPGMGDPNYIGTCFDNVSNNCEVEIDCGCSPVRNNNCVGLCNSTHKNNCPPCLPPLSNGGGTTACRGMISQIHPSGYCHSSANPVKLNYRINRSCNGVEVQWFKVVSETTMVATTDLTTIETGGYLSPNVKEYESTFNFATPPTFPYEAEYAVRLVKGTEILAEERFPITLYAPVTVNAGDDKFICLGSSVSLGGSPTATGGTGNYSYHWTTDNTTASAWLTRGTRYSANPSFVPTVAGIYTYTLEARDGFACSASDVMTLTVNNPGAPNFTDIQLLKHFGA